MPKNEPASTPPRNKRNGRGPGFNPSPEQRGMVEAMVGFGMIYDEICKMIVNPATGNPICKHTLISAFRPELDRGLVVVKTKVIGALFRNATINENVAAQIFWLKTREGWKEPKEEYEPPAPTVDMEKNQLEVARRVAFTLALGHNINSKKSE